MDLDLNLDLGSGLDLGSRLGSGLGLGLGLGLGSGPAAPVAPLSVVPVELFSSKFSLLEYYHN